MSKYIVALMSRLTYLVIGAIIGVFAYHEFSLDLQQQLANQLRTHQLAVQQMNSSVVSFSTQSVDQDLERTDIDSKALIQQQARLEFNLNQLTMAYESLLLSRETLLTEAKRLPVGSTESELIQDDISQVDQQMQDLTVSIEQLESELSGVQQQLAEFYKEVSESIEDTFADIIIE